MIPQGPVQAAAAAIVPAVFGRPPERPPHLEALFDHSSESRPFLSTVLRSQNVVEPVISSSLHAQLLGYTAVPLGPIVEALKNEVVTRAKSHSIADEGQPVLLSTTLPLSDPDRLQNAFDTAPTSLRLQFIALECLTALANVLGRSGLPSSAAPATEHWKADAAPTPGSPMGGDLVILNTDLWEMDCVVAVSFLVAALPEWFPLPTMLAAMATLKRSSASVLTSALLVNANALGVSLPALLSPVIVSLQTPPPSIHAVLLAIAYYSPQHDTALRSALIQAAGTQTLSPALSSSILASVLRANELPQAFTVLSAIKNVLPGSPASVRTAFSAALATWIGELQSSSSSRHPAQFACALRMLIAMVVDGGWETTEDLTLAVASVVHDPQMCELVPTSGPNGALILAWLLVDPVSLSVVDDVVETVNRLTRGSETAHSLVVALASALSRDEPKTLSDLVSRAISMPVKLMDMHAVPAIETLSAAGGPMSEKAMIDGLLALGPEQKIAQGVDAIRISAFSASLRVPVWALHPDRPDPSSLFLSILTSSPVLPLHPRILQAVDYYIGAEKPQEFEIPQDSGPHLKLVWSVPRLAPAVITSILSNCSGVVGALMVYYALAHGPGSAHPRMTKSLYFSHAFLASLPVVSLLAWAKHPSRRSKLGALPSLIEAAQLGSIAPHVLPTPVSLPLPPLSVQGGLTEASLAGALAQIMSQSPEVTATVLTIASQCGVLKGTHGAVILVDSLPLILTATSQGHSSGLLHEAWQGAWAVVETEAHARGRLAELYTGALSALFGAPLSSEELSRNPLLVLQMPDDVWTSPAVIGVVLSALKYFLSCCRHVLLTEDIGSMADTPLAGTFVSAQEGAAAGKLLEVLGQDGLEDAVRDTICGVLHEQFIASPTLLKLVAFQGLPASAIEHLVEGVPSVHIALDWIPELLEQPREGSTATGIALGSALVEKYPLERARPAAIAVVGAAMRVAESPQGGGVVAFSLSWLVKIGRVFPDIGSDLVGWLRSLRGRPGLSERSPAVIGEAEDTAKIVEASVNRHRATVL